jgi:thiamine biosynthesis protein ThiS
MTLTINGEARTASAENLTALVDELRMKPDRVAIELNRQIIPRDQWPQTKLNDGDQLEIVHFVGGGATPGHFRAGLHLSMLNPRFYIRVSRLDKPA